MSLFDLYVEAIEKSDFHFPDGVVQQFLSDPSSASARNMMTENLKFRSKSVLLDHLNLEPQSIFHRSVHSVSVFMLGLAFRALVIRTIERIASRRLTDPDPFAFLWMLTSLYHDVYSDGEHTLSEGNYPSLDSFKYSIYQSNAISKKLCSRVHFHRPTYHQETVHSYYAYRCASKSPDHGILSGFKCFDELMKSYLTVQEKVYAANVGDQIDVHEQQGRLDYKSDDCKTFQITICEHTLEWNQNLIWAYAYVADAIIAHNIWHLEYSWFPEEIRKKAPGEKKLSPRKDPLAYYLCLIDTIEPIKYFNNCHPKAVIENISMELENNKIIISQSEQRLFDLQSWYYSKFYNSVKDEDQLSLWLENTFSVYDERNNRIVVSLL